MKNYVLVGDIRNDELPYHSFAEKYKPIFDSIELAKEAVIDAESTGRKYVIVELELLKQQITRL